MLSPMTRSLPWLLAPLLVLLSCPGPDDPDDPDPPEPPATCGDGAVDDGEECDDGGANSDTEPDACRTSCVLPWCGDGVADGGEACDDGTLFGGDGCTPLCETEDGALESEPNDTPGQAEAWADEPVHGGLPEGDVDCYAVPLEACAAIGARLTGDCPAPATLTLHDPAGDLVATGGPGEDGCAVLDPAEAPGARFVAEGTYAVCVQGLLGGAVPWYVIELEVIDPEDASYPVEESEDPDGDGKPDGCDADKDGDGVDNEDDNCPDTPNGPDAPPVFVPDDGFIRVFLAAGPFTGLSSPQDCQPTTENLVGVDDALVAPALGDPAGENQWVVLWSTGDRIDFLPDYGWATEPREVYHAVYVYSAAEQEVSLALGPDDGVRAWLDGAVVMDEPGCQGTVIDQFTAPVTLLAGWNRLMIKVYDQYGGWGNYVRFLDDGGDPVTGLELSLDPAGSWSSNQADADGDGEGDVCDDTPTGS